MDGLNMFWGGAPEPLDKDKIDPEEFTLTRDRDDEYASEPEYFNPQTGETGIPTKRTAADVGKSLRVPGGIAATSKKIVADYDSDDARIIELKQQGYADEYVSGKLTEEGRMRYVSKTIGSRWLRLRKVLEDREDERLDDELSDWHVGEDEMVATIKSEVDRKFEIQFKRLKDKMWQEVSIYLADKIGKRKYTAKACYERFEAIKDGTALLPIELDDDQPGRRKLREERIAKAIADRAANKQALIDAEHAKAARIAARKAAQVEMAVKKATEQERKTKERRDAKRIKREREITRQKLKRAQTIRLAQMRVQRDWEMAKWRAEKQLYAQFSGKQMPGQGKNGQRKRKTADGYETEDDEDDEEFGYGNLSDEEEAQMTDDEGNDSVMQSSGKKSTAARRRANPVRKTRGKGKAKKSKKDVPSEPLPAIVEDDFNKAPVSKETLLNPRSIMTLSELDACLYSRGLIQRHPSESHAEVVSRLAHADNELTVPELNELLKAVGETLGGKKDAKIQRLQAAEASNSESGSAGVISTELDFMRTYEGYQGEFAYLLDEADGEDGDAMDVA